jgi:hypothetical protein
MSSNKAPAATSRRRQNRPVRRINWLIRIVVGLVDSQNDVTNQPKRVFLDAFSRDDQKTPQVWNVCAEAPKAKVHRRRGELTTRMNRCGTVRGRGLETE